MADGKPAPLLDFGSVGRIDAPRPPAHGAAAAAGLALDRGDPAGLADALLEVLERPGELDEPRLERMLGRFLARQHRTRDHPRRDHVFTDLFRIVSEHGLAVPPEIAAVFRALATMEGTLTALAPGFDIVAEARPVRHRPAHRPVQPGRNCAGPPADELIALLPALRRLPRRIDRLGGALEAGFYRHRQRPAPGRPGRPPLPHRPAAPGHPRASPGRHLRHHGRADARPARRAVPSPAP